MSVASRKAVFISGQGSNLKALIDAYPNEKFYVFSNKVCNGLLWAKKRGIYTQVVSLKDFNDWKGFSEKIKALKISMIYLLGFMKLVPKEFLNSCGADCLNIHPSVLPDFKGLNAMERSFDDKKAMGCTLHKVTPLMDEGEIVLQKKMNEGFMRLEKDQFFNRVHAFEQKTICHQFQMSRGR